MGVTTQRRESSRLKMVLTEVARLAVGERPDHRDLALGRRRERQRVVLVLEQHEGLRGHTPAQRQVRRRADLQPTPPKSLSL